MAGTDERDTRKHLLLELGRGGMGTVYLAVARGPADIRKLKVVKRLHPQLARDRDFARGFLDEGRISARLHHPNVVYTTDVGTDGANYFIEMEYLEGQSLDAVLRALEREGEAMPPELAAWIASQMLAGLHHAHELRGADGAPLGVVHRDVSPHNVFVTYDGAIKLLDFGIAKAADSILETRTGVVKGKVAYMAPEQAARRALDRRADVYAAGVVLWRMLAGRRPWEGHDETEVLAALVRGDGLPPPSRIRREVPPSIDAVCARCLAASPDARYATAAEAQAAIEDALHAMGARTGARAMSSFLLARFAEVREAVRAQIEQRMAAIDAGSGDETEADVPPAASTRDAPTEAATRVRESGPERTIAPTAVRAPAPATPWKGIALAAIAVAGLAGAAEIARAVSSSRSSAAPIPSASASASPPAPSAPAAPELEPTVLVSDVRPWGIALHDGAVFFTEPLIGKLLRIGESDGEPVDLSSMFETRPFEIVIEGDAVYWGALHSVFRCEVQGCRGQPVEIVHVQESPRFVVADATNVYWMEDAGFVRKADKRGNAQIRTLLQKQKGRTPRVLALHGDQLYLGTAEGEVLRIPTAGGPPDRVSPPGAPGPVGGIALDDDDVYWSATNSDGAIYAANVRTHAWRTIATGQLFPYGVAVDAERIYWAAVGSLQHDGAIRSCSLATCAKPETIAKELDAPKYVAQDDRFVYWSVFGNPTGGGIMKRRKH